MQTFTELIYGVNFQNFKSHKSGRWLGVEFWSHAESLEEWLYKQKLEGFSLTCITTVFAEFLAQTQFPTYSSRRFISQPRKFMPRQSFEMIPTSWCWRKAFMSRSTPEINTKTFIFFCVAFTVLQSPFTELIYGINLLNYKNSIQQWPSNGRRTKNCHQSDH